MNSLKERLGELLIKALTPGELKLLIACFDCRVECDGPEIKNFVEEKFLRRRKEELGTRLVALNLQGIQEQIENAFEQLLKLDRERKYLLKKNAYGEFELPKKGE